MRLHEPLNAVFAHPDASREQRLAYPWPAVFAFDLGVDGSDMRQQHLVAVPPAGHAGPVLRAPALVLEVAADTGVQNLADQRDWPHRPEQKNPGVLHSDSLATATDLADYLTKKGLPFRGAHKDVAHAAKLAIQDLSALSLAELQAMHPTIEADVHAALTLRGSLAARNVLGGTAPVQVLAQVARHRARQV